jgi:hypothetical protein
MNSRDKQVGGDHYLSMGIQPWDVIRAWGSIEEYRGFLKGSALAYIGRAGRKGSAEDDYRKAMHCLEALLETYEEGKVCLK